jgi:radical SAM superfamily enzyme
LQLLNRNHSFNDFIEAFELISSFETFQAGVHILLGIPGETEDNMMQKVQYVCSLGVDALKLHHLQVIESTPLHKMYVDGKVTLFSRKQYLNLLLKILPVIPQDVVIHRLWTTSHPDILIAPKWNVLPGELSKELHNRMDELGIEQGCLV